MSEVPSTGSTMWPNLFVVGAMKAGTTSLHALLDSHDAIAMSAIKEPNHFGSDIPMPSGPLLAWDSSRYERYLAGHGPAPHQAYVRDVSRYLALFEGTAPWRGEASVSYLYSETAVAEIMERRPAARFVVILRDPVQRVLSHHGSEVAIGRERERDPLVAIRQDLEREQTWGQAFLYAGLGMYGPQVARLLARAGPDSVLVLFFDDLLAGQAAERLADFLDVDVAGFGDPERRNPGVRPRFHRLNRLLRRTGLKGAVSRIAPRSVLAAGKRIFYRPSGGIGAAPANHVAAELRPLFADSDRQLWELLGCEPRWSVDG